ncbi:hypothetical protein [Nocardia sp. NPDC057668]|uniref:hypothetical protein n=1 Tax=Nocardia sp. NPDC057668 TaxID=3346202 RepID=UPI0036707744
MTNWRDLDADVRKALLRGEPAADPEIDRIARERAEKVLGRSTVRQTLVLIPPALVLGVLLGFLGARTGVSALGLPVVFVVIVGWVVFATRRKLAYTRILNVSGGTPRTPISGGGERVPDAAARLEVRVSAGGALRMMAPLLSISGIVFAAGAVFSAGWLLGIGVVLAVPTLAYTGFLLWAARPGNEIVIDADGLSIPGRRLWVAWDAVREIRVFPLRATAGDERRVVSFLLHDKQVYLRQLPRWQAFLADLNTRTYLSPLAMVDGLTDTPVEEIAAASVALSGIAATTEPPAR